MMNWLLICAIVALGLLWLRFRFFDFAAQKPEDYLAGPKFDIRQSLNGPIACEGVIYGPLGRVSSRFSADFEAEWNGTAGVMREHFLYDSGNRQDRVWSLRLEDDGTVRATAPDLIGEGVGQQKGSAMMLKYKIKLTEDAGGHVLDVTDWMYLAPNGVIVNRSQFRKFGIKVGELIATMRPGEAA